MMGSRDMQGHRRIDLSQGWQFRRVGEASWHPATVPGCNVTDLLDNGLVAHPFEGTSERALEWIEREDWEYRCTFDVGQEMLDAEGALAIVFEGLDTVCAVTLNGEPLLDADNMFRTWRVDLAGRLRAGANELAVHFRSPVAAGEERAAADDFMYPAENDKTEGRISPYLRKAPYHFGWDWGPKYAVSGIWRPVYLEFTPVARIVNIAHVIGRLDADRAEVAFDIEIDGPAVDAGHPLELVCTREGAEGRVSCPIAPGANMARIAISIDDPDLWWPNGLGEPSLYAFTFALAGADGPLDVASRRIGLRTIEVVNEPDAMGESFYLKVNGLPVFMKGANYIPPDSFLDRMTEERYRRVFADARDAHFNMLRVWGGGAYECDLFYDLADEQGILIWQDFMFACTLYPSDDAFFASVRAEAEQAVRRLRHHASLALWCGNNEIDLGIAHWKWPETFAYSPDRFAALVAGNKRLFEDLLPAVISEQDPHRFYFPSSPIGHWNDPEDDSRGDGHYWGVWHGELPFDSYNDRLSRFMSEYGFQSYPLMSSIARFAAPEEQVYQSATLAGRQKHPRGDAIISRFIAEMFGAPASFEDFCYLSQLVQADGLRVAFEAHRRNRPFCMGTLYWQLNDCWPAISWSSIDYYGQWKALHYQAARSFAPTILSLRQMGETLEVWGISDLLQSLATTLAVEWLDASGRLLSERVFERTVGPASATMLLAIGAADTPAGFDPLSCVLRVTLREGERVLTRQLHDFVAPSRKMWSDPGLAFTLETDGAILLRCETYARGVHIIARAEGDLAAVVNFDDNFFDLLPGEERRVRPRHQLAIDPASVAVRSLHDALAADDAGQAAARKKGAM